MMLMKTCAEIVPLAPGSLVKVVKRAVCPNPAVASGSWDKWQPGQINEPLSLPVDYEIVGNLLGSISVGGRIHVLRFERNGVEALGMFTSSPIVAIHDDGSLSTLNSVYEIIAL